jgi:hypothetical protein
MTASIRSFGTTVMLAGLTAVLAAQGAPKMNVKMGLWEMTSTMAMSGDMPGVDSSKMSPEQQAQMRAAMASMANKPTTTQSCLTKEKFENGQMMAKDNCKQTLVTNTSTAYDVKVECNQNGTMSTGTMHFEAPTPETVKGKFDMQSTTQGKTMNITGNITGKFVSTDCGKVK